MDLTVVIAQRDEPELLRTVRNVREACGEDQPEILIVNDGPPKKPYRKPDHARIIQLEASRGCQAARDAGIEAAKRSKIAIIDAHMDFEPGLFAKMAAETGPEEVTCSRCCHIHPPWTPQRQEPGYSGAYLVWQDGTVPLFPKWRDVETPEEIPCVLGACYVFSREWYLKGLARPWCLGTGWGCDEELLSVANWLCGGRNRVINTRAWHLFRDAKDIPWAQSAATIAGRMANRMRMVLMLPMPPAWKRQLLEPLEREARATMQQDRVEALLNRESAEVYCDFLAGQRRTFQEWRNLFCCEKDPRTSAGGDVRHRPGYVNPSPATTTAAPRSAKGFVGEARCPHCGGTVGHRKLHDYGANARWLCGSCQRPFIQFARG
jgi:hypothetical protein